MKWLFIGLILCLTFLFSYSLNQTKTPTPMNDFDYNAAWVEVNNFVNQGLPESALNQINLIYSSAKTENNAGQLVKAVIYILKLTDYKEEDAYYKNLNRLKQEVKTANFPAKPILHSMLAEMYWRYYQSNRSIFSQRTETVDFKNDDISTWSLENIVNETIKNYNLSLETPEKLKTTKIDVYTDILHTGNKKGRAYRPTLYDFLANRAIDFFMDEEPSITRPAEAFTINSEEYLMGAEDFCKLNISSNDSMAYKFYALKLLQDLTKFHLKDEKPDALVDIDLKRLHFVYQNLTLQNKQELYLLALSSLEQKTIKYPVSCLVTYQIAQVWMEKGNLYSPNQSDDHKWDIKKAFDICAVAIKRFPDADESIPAYNFQKQLERKSISAQTENINVPGEPFRALVNYKNFTDLYWRIIKVSRKEVRVERNKWVSDREEKFLEYFNAKEPLKTGKVVLPDDKDYQQHSAEIILEGLPTGEYMVLFSATPDFKIDNNNLSYTFTTISNLAYYHRNMDDGTTDMYVMNRTSGEPLSEAMVQVYKYAYNSKKGDYEYIKSKILTSDASGYVKIPLQSDKNNYSNPNAFFVDISYQSDKISTSAIDYYDYIYDNIGIISQNKHYKSSAYSHTIFFLDRAIYRPGQTVFFKGLLFSTDFKNPVILPRKSLTVTFYDVNNQVVANKEVVTNDYGTFSGSFIAPTSGLTGQMYLMASDNSSSSVYFSVEEYKRPKFEVLINPVQGSFRLGETIRFTGKAAAYSGANIDGAKLSYRIVRSARFPYWWYCWRGYYPTSQEMEITNGIGSTDNEGKFFVDFKAIADETIDRNSDPIFNYTIYADITDINGETHSQSSSVSVGYKSLLIGVAMHDIDLSNDDALNEKFAITSTNLSGEFEPATGNISIWKLKSPAKAYRQRLWEKPDKQVLSETDFHKFFPNDLYDDENNFYKWEREKEVYKNSFETSKEKFLNLKKISNWLPGKYTLEITSKDKFGQAVKDVVYFEVFNSKSKELSYPVIHQLLPLKTNCEPGETAKIVALSSENLNVLYELEQDGKILSSEWLNLDNQKQLLEIPIKEEFRGNIAVHYTFVKDNRFYTEEPVITVPYTNKELDIKFESFRDKLQPGQEEQWKLKIIGDKAEKVAAEMVATLYDASLDVFRENSWGGWFYHPTYPRLSWTSNNGFIKNDFRNYAKDWNNRDSRYYRSPSFATLNWFDYNLYHYYNTFYNEIDEVVAYGVSSRSMKKMATDGSVMEMEDNEIMRSEAAPIKREKDNSATTPDVQSLSGNNKKPPLDFGDVKVRKNFNETAFFYPHLQTNENGEIIINFTIPEALTRWKMLGFAHSKDLKSGLITNELKTQKDLMVVPNQPRFFRENDKMIFSAKITSLVDKELSGEARLEFFDALTMKPIDSLIKNSDKQKPFTLKEKQSTNVEWKIEIPEGVQAINYKIVAKAGNFSDGEEMTLPVVTNSMLVIETLPLPIRGKQSKTFRLDKLVDNTSTTLRNNRFTLEFTSNPAWYAVQALPYLMEYPYECTEQTFSRYYANSIASHISNSNPKIKAVFDVWANIQPDALLSKLEKNQELKSALLEETPWVLNAKSESERKRNVGLLFDLNRMGNELERAMKKIMEAQNSSGGFSWFSGMPEDRYITQYLVSGMGHLDVMGVKSVRDDSRVWQMIVKALNYMDREMQEHYAFLKAEAAKGRLNLENNNLDYIEIQYLYARSYFREIKINNRCQEGFDYFLGQTKKYWLENDIYMQGMMALALHRNNDKLIPAAIIKSFSERALHSDEMGMYWKYYSGYYWYQAPIETQALMIEVYDEVANDLIAVEDLKVWLLKQKQTQDWKTTKATSEACYALLRRGTNVLASDAQVEITIGGERIDPKTRPDAKIEAGTGYFKTAWTASEIKPEMGNITVTKTDDGVAWGAVYWQYFEQLDKITPAETPLKLDKKLFLQQNTARGPVITPITEKTKLKPGDLIKVRIELRVDRTMEYVHMKDMRAAAFEPVETISSYKYQDGLHYYESPRDLATNFFFGWLPKGTYVFEYPLRVSQKGDFSNGVTTIQCMYAPEFSSHSEGIRVMVE
jgi:uncharacterized protein YfaS (alpha-2-macroglobulin family)